MQIGSMGSTPSMSAMAMSEPMERGPDRDNDGDEGGVQAASTAASVVSKPPANRGQVVDLSA